MKLISPARINLISLLGLLGFIAGCSAPPPPQTPAKPLMVAKVSAGGTALAAQRIYSGELRPRIETTLGFQVGGKIVERLVNVGDHVRAGQVLARLDPQDTRLSAQQADAQLEQARAEASRYRELQQRRFVSQAALDERENKFKSAQAQASLARNQSAYTTLVAGKPGVIGLVQSDIGQVVTPGQAVFRMAPDGDREIVVNIPEAEYSLFKTGMKAEVSLFATPGQTYLGRIREISPVADPVTRTYPLRIQLTGIELLPTGLTASVRFPAESGDKAAAPTLSVPLTAIAQKGEMHAVWVVGDNNVVNLRPVKISRYSDTYAVISEGLKADERIAIAGANSLTEGQVVRPIELSNGNSPGKQP